MSPSDVLCEIITDATLCHPRSSPQWRLCCFYLSRHPLFISASVNFIPFHLPPCSRFVALLLSSHFSNKQHFPSYELLLMMPLLMIRHILAAITVSLTAPCFIFFIIPVFYCFSTHSIFRPSLTDLQQRRILFFFLLAGAYCPDTHSNRPVSSSCCFFFHNAEIKGESETLIVLVMRAKRYGFSLVFKDVITVVRLCFH